MERRKTNMSEHSYITKASANYKKNMESVIPGGVYQQQYEQYPFYLSHAQHSRVWDLDGNEYLDLHNKYGAVLIGHHVNKLTKALQEAVECQIPNNSTRGYDICMHLKKYITGCDKFQFGLSGSEMVLHAIRLAQRYTGRDIIIRFDGCYHGSYNGMQTDRNIDKKMISDKYSVHILPWNELETLKNFIDHYSNRICAIITEPICVNGGGFMPKKNYLKGLRNICDKNSIVLIFDEIITGFRLGAGGAQALYDVQPDLCLLGKCLTNGLLPVTILGGKKSIMDLYLKNDFIYTGTFNGYSLGLETAWAVLNLFETEYEKSHRDMCRRIEKIHTIFKQTCHDYDLELEIQGHITCASYHVTKSQIKTYAELTDDIIQKNNILRKCMLKYGILTAPISRLYPNWSLSDDDVEFFEKRIIPAVRETKKLLKHI